MGLISTPILLLLSAAPAARGQADAPAQPLFAEEEIPGSATVCGSPDKKYIIEVNGGGLALEDFDRDGDVDLLLVDGSTLEAVAAGEPGRAASHRRSSRWPRVTMAMNVPSSMGSRATSVAMLLQRVWTPSG